MSRIFISHSTANTAEAIAIRDWLEANGWDDIFLDVDPERGLKAGERWQVALRNAAERCELVIFLISPAWAKSKWCITEFLLAKSLNKRILGAIVDPTPLKELPLELTSEWQVADLTRGTRDCITTVTPPGSEPVRVALASEELARLRVALIEAGIDARYFQWPPGSDPERSPYPGLRPLEAEDAGIFFGRDGQVVLGLDAMRGLRDQPPPRILVILGASGAGKSSFMRAGLLPRLARDDRHFLPLPIIRPDRAALTGATGLIASLEAALKTAGMPRSRAAIRVAVNDSAGLAQLLDTLLAAHVKRQSGSVAPPTIVLPIDQAEELFLAEGAAEANAFLSLLCEILRQHQSSIIALFTIRSVNYERLQMAPQLEGLRQHTLSLPPMPRGSYADVIKGPARRLDDTKRPLKIEETLVDTLLSDVEASGAKDALPLLAFSLERLYREHHSDGRLTLAEYRELGGLEGAIEAAVEQAFKEADRDGRVPRDRSARLMLLRRGLIPWLAGIDPDTGVPRRRVARLSEVPAEAQPLFDHLVEQRLLSTDISGETGEKTIEPAHEALLRRWGQLSSWLTEDHALLSTLDGVKRASRDWASNGRQHAWLIHRADRLAAAERLVDRADLSASLEPTDRDYLAACGTAQRMARRASRRNRIAVGALAATILLGLVAWKNQAALKEAWVWHFIAKPYMESNFRPFVLSAGADQGLKPLSTFRECQKDCPEMVVLPPGSFTMGSPPDEPERSPDEEPQRGVKFEQAFAISKFPITFDDWDACVSTGGCVEASASGFGRGRKPAVNIGWADANAYAGWLSRMTGKSYRLLTEAEWEYAARAGSEDAYWFGDVSQIDKFTWYVKNAGEKPHDVGEKPANAFGVFDMTGQVWQWVADCYYESYLPPVPGAECKGHVARGGSWDSNTNSIRSARRGWYAADRKSQFLGFRIAREIESAPPDANVVPPSP